MGIEVDLKRIADAVEVIATFCAQAGSADPKAPKRERKANTTTEAVDVDPPAPAPAAPAAKRITEQELREELRQFIVRHETKGKGKGMEAATELLKKFGAKTVSTIKEDNYGPIVKFCQEDKKAHDAANAKK